MAVIKKQAAEHSGPFKEETIMKKLIVILLAVLMITALAACNGSVNNTPTTAETAASDGAATAADSPTAASTSASGSSYNAVTATAAVTSTGVIDASDLFSDRDLRQNADLSEAVYCTVSDGQDISITAAGVYVLSGTASNVTVRVDAGDDDKVQIVLNGVSIANSSAPAVYVLNADKVFITTAEGTANSLTVSGSFTADGTTNTDAVIFSKDDIVLNGLGTLNISSTDNGISCKDDLKITGGTINITCSSDAIEANDSILISDGTVTISTDKDGLHAENDEDNTVGYIYICGGTLDIGASSDGIQGTTVVQIDGGTISIDASEGIEATYVQINGGEIRINASDDGINASRKSSSYTPTAEFNGGYIYINMGQGDTDGVDSNGNIYVNGGTLDIYANSPFDYDSSAEYNGGTIIVNGETTNQITNQFGVGMGGPGGDMGGMGGPGGNMGGFGR